MVCLDFSFITDCGIKRPINQDYYYAQKLIISGEEAGFFVVADGMGGHNKGEIASEMAVDSLKNYVLRHLNENPHILGDLQIMLSRAFYETNKIVFEESIKNEKFSGMGTTLIAAIINASRLIVANVGDSRAYVFREEGLYQLTIDNSYVQELVEKGVIRPEDARTHPQKNVITRAIGTDKHVRVDFYSKELKKNDLIILCSDGLTNMVDDLEIENILKSCENPKSCCNSLVELANKKGGKDNITIVCVVV